MQNSDNNNQTFGSHLEVLRQMLFRILGISLILALVVFIFKDFVWDILLAPSKYDFITYRGIEHCLQALGIDFHFPTFEVDFITTELSSQFMLHMSTSFYLGILVSSPYLLYELFMFVVPALYDNERKYAKRFVYIVYLLFLLGVLLSYFIIFPITFRFLSTYSIQDCITSVISLNSYVSTFTSLTLVMGVVFQLPVIAYILAKLGIADFKLLAKYRKQSLFIITIVSAFITPPDIMSCILVTVPLYLLYEISILIAKKVYKED
jgi:sec-independent protein translocase protein TatC